MTVRVNWTCCSLVPVAVCLLLSVGTGRGQQLERFPTNPAGAAALAADTPGNLSLIIANTEPVHDQIETLLDQLRRLQGVSTVVEVPFTQSSDDFFERIGVNFGFSLPGGRTPGATNVVGLDPAGNPTPDGNLVFRQGGFSSATPPFGGHDPGADATFGFRIGRGGGPTFDFNFAMGQGNNRSFTTTAPVVHAMDGQPAAVADISQMPFVTSVIPVVGAYGGLRLPLGPAPTSPLRNAIRQYVQQQGGPGGELAERARQSQTKLDSQPDLPREEKLALQLAAARSSSAGHGDLSVAEIRRQAQFAEQARQQVDQQQVLVLVERARGAADQGNIGAAKIYYRLAAKRATPDLRQQILRELAGID